jgi:poly-gamma-glutamate capsule biosynthesis protein CapA/YwtB (metallophosphatase superfamily)
MAQTKNVIISFTGDIGPNRDEPDSIFRNVADILRASDICFGQLEVNLSDRGTPLPQARLPMRSSPDTARAIKEAGYSIVSFASNHSLDWGQDALLDTIANLRKHGLSVIGAGSSINEAREPVILESNGVRTAFFAYCSILPMGYRAEDNRPGCAPLRAWTLYEQIGHDQPGTPSRVHTFAHRADTEAMIEDIRNAKTQADVVIVSMHWGVHFIPGVIAGYERETAHTAIDNGADIIIGHHPHILKGIEVYNGKAIFYSLGNFALELPFAFNKSLRGTKQHKEIEALNPGWTKDPEYPMPPDTRKTILVKCTVTNKKIDKVSFLPVYLNAKGEPEFVKAGDARFVDVADYLKDLTQSQNFNTDFKFEEDEVVVL